jgi:oligopeptide/dipeptide ABC transporter ATP-binding protein
MYGGRIVEEASTEALFDRQHMPYAAGLLAATPRLDRPAAGRLRPIRGRPPEPIGPTTSCRFAPRCDLAQAICRETAPALRRVAPGHRAACHFAEQAPALLREAGVTS